MLTVTIQHRNKVIHLKDNSIKTIRITPDCEDIRLLANQTIESLVDRNPGLLVYPQCLKDCDDDLKKQLILSEYETVDQNQQRNMHITTGNIIGFIGTSSSDLSICSRFTGDNGLGQDFFLHYMLQRVLSINLFNLNHSTSTEDQAFDFLLLLFPAFLKVALAQGLYKEYVSFRHNDANVRGIIDINRHLNHNIPFNGCVAYNSREISYDNSVTELIRHTIECISSTDFGKAVLAADKDTIDAVSQIKSATPSYSRNERQSVIRSNTKAVSHTFFTKYQDLQKLCIRILRHRKLKYGNGNSKINGILFDASWLWEEYLAKLLPSMNHPRNRKGTGAIYLAEKHSLQRFPDFYKGEKDGIVLDAKYKHSVGRDDEHQVISYMYRLKSKLGGFILPAETNTPKISYSLLGYGYDLNIHYLQIPQVETSYKYFFDKMSVYEKSFVAEIQEMLDKASIKQ